MSLALSRWIEQGRAILITGATGLGKSWLGCALAQYACRRGQSALYPRTPRLAEELRLLHGNGGFSRWLATVARTDLLVLDDWGIAALVGPTRSDLMEIFDDRAGTRATIATSQLPVEHCTRGSGTRPSPTRSWTGCSRAASVWCSRGKSMRPSETGSPAAGDTPVRAGDGEPH